MRCADCLNGDLVQAHRHKSAERDGRVAVVTGVPVTLCPSCGMVWFDADVAVALDAMLTSMLDQEIVAVRRYDDKAPSAA